MNKEIIQFEEYYNDGEWIKAYSYIYSSDFDNIRQEKSNKYIYYTCWDNNDELTFWYRNKIKKVCPTCGKEMEE
jgi:hypothetical protein